VDVVNPPADSNQTTASPRRPASMMADRGFIDTETMCGGRHACPRSSSAKVCVRSIEALLPPLFALGS